MGQVSPLKPKLGRLKGYVKSRIRAAEKGQPEALYDLGLIYSTGQGASMDLISAHKWFNLAAIRGVRRAMVDRAEVALEMSHDEIEQAQRLAREWQTIH